MKSKLLIMIGIFCLAEPTYAEVNSGADLQKNCNAAVKHADGGNLTEEESLGSVYCAGYLSGFMDSHIMGTNAKPKKPLYCLPKNGLANIQMARILITYFAKHPERLHEPARLQAVSALLQSFPCKKP